MTLEERLDRQEARAAIADLVHGYALAIRRDRPEDVAALFVPEGTFEVRDGAPDSAEFTPRDRFNSPQALVSYLLRGKGRPHPVPLIHNLMIAVEGDTARASSVMAGPIPGTDHEVFGEYDDRFAKLGGEWKFASRVFTVFR